MKKLKELLLTMYIVLNIAFIFISSYLRLIKIIEYKNFGYYLHVAAIINIIVSIMLILIKKKDLDLAKLVRKRAQLIEARLGKKKLLIDVPEKLSANISEADFSQVLDVLLDNAVKYSKTMISIGLDEKKLIVTNDGKTIPPEKLDKVFDRFYQTDKTAEGSGLGLAIAAAVCKQNGWKIEAQSDKKTTSFILSF